MSTQTLPGATGTRIAAPGALPRLLPAGPGQAGPGQADLRAHLGRLGSPPYRNRAGLLIGDIKAAGLTGRGGAAFPVHRKLAAVANARKPAVVIANGAESEPASGKDRELLWRAPHLVLDGLQLAAEAVGAAAAALAAHRDARLHQHLRTALAERAAAGLDRVDVALLEAPPRFLSGAESALVRAVNGGPAVPGYQPPRVFEKGVGGRPTLVQNVETLAHLAIIARFGPAWFRSVGTPDEPGSMLCSVWQAGGGSVTEVALGTPIASLLTITGDVQAVLCGGYHGAWLDPGTAAGLSLCNASLRPAGVLAGPGVLVALPADRCGLAETARVARYLALESAGQCGPCLNGLPRMANALTELAGPRPSRQALANLQRWAGLVEGRGACHHPDGTVRFVRSALTVFGREIGRHAGGRCAGRTGRPFLPLPPAPQTTEASWR
jgi:NADH:ubiquinone oxidoreductase subunit F (NADH-binding)